MNPVNFGSTECIRRLAELMRYLEHGQRHRVSIRGSIGIEGVDLIRTNTATTGEESIGYFVWNGTNWA